MPQSLSTQSVAESLRRHMKDLLTSRFPEDAPPGPEPLLELIRGDLGAKMAGLYSVDRSRESITSVAMAGVPASMRGRLSLLRYEALPALRDLLDLRSPYIIVEAHGEQLPLGERLLRELRLDDDLIAVFPVGNEGRPETLLLLVLPKEPGLGDERIRDIQEMTSLLDVAIAFGERLQESMSTRRRAEESLHTSNLMLRAAEALTDDPEFDAVISTLADLVHDVTGHKNVAINLFEEGGERLIVSASRGTVHREGSSISRDALDPLLQSAFHEKRSILIEHGVCYSLIPDVEDGCAPMTFMSVPLITDHGLLGDIEVDETGATGPEVRRDMRLVEGVAFQASSAVENARLYERQRRSARLRELLNEINALLAESLENPSAMGKVLAGAKDALGAEYGAIAMVTEGAWVVEHTDGEGRWHKGSRLAEYDKRQALSAYRTRAPVIRLTSHDTDQAVVVSSARQGDLVVPLHLQDRLLGVMIFSKGDWLTVLDNETLDFASKLGSAVSMALGNRYIYEHEHRIADTLQQALLSVPEHLPGLQVEHYYESAAERARVGGDFYDAFALGQGSVGLVIGDVSGKGLSAAALTAVAKNTIRAHALEGLEPAEVLEHTNEVVFRFSESESFVTVFYGVIDPGGTIRWASAGHPSPLVLRASNGGHVESLGQPGGALLGAFPGLHFGQATAQLHAGDTLLLYTDGVIEARRDGELYGEERLKRLFRQQRNRALHEVPRAIVTQLEEYSTPGLQDDLALMLVKLD